jgi:hypothetical protein
MLKIEIPTKLCYIPQCLLLACYVNCILNKHLEGRGLPFTADITRMVFWCMEGLALPGIKPRFAYHPFHCLFKKHRAILATIIII